MQMAAAKGVQRRQCLLAGAGWVAAWAGARPAWAQASAEPRVIERDWWDASRERAVPVRAYLPPLAASRGAVRPVPLVLFSHGLGGSREGYSYLGRFLAEHGMASLHVQHVGSDRSLWAGNRLTLVFRLNQAVAESEVRARVSDLRFALDQALVDDTLGPQVDPERVAAAGHSFGANTALLAGGAQVRRRGEVLKLADERLRGLLLLSAPPFHGEGNPVPVLAPIRVPSLHVTNTEDEINVPGYHSTAEDRLALYEAIGSPRKALAVFTGGGHSIFTDRLSPGGAVLNAQVKAATQGLAWAFLRELFGLPEAGPDLLSWQREHAGLLDRFDTRGIAARA